MIVCGNCMDFKDCELTFGIDKNDDALTCPEYKEKKKHNCSDCKKAEFDCSPCNFEIE